MRRPELSVDFMGFNMQHPLFKDARVRRAIAMALDKDALQKVAGKGYAPAMGILPPGIPGYTPESKTYSHDPEQARELLAKAGYTKDKPLRIPMMTISQSEYRIASDSILVASLAKVGIVVELQKVTWDEYDQAIGERTATILSLAWIADLPDPDSFLYTLFISNGGSNLFGYSNPEVDSLIVESKNTLDREKRRVINQRLHKLLAEECPYTFLWSLNNYAAVHKKVRKVEIHPFKFFSYVDEWYIPKKEQK